MRYILIAIIFLSFNVEVISFPPASGGTMLLRSDNIRGVKPAYEKSSNPNTYIPLKFITPRDNGPREMVYPKKELLVIWAFRNKKSYRNLDLPNIEYTVSVTNIFEEPFKTFVLKDTVLMLTYDMLPPNDDNVLLTLEAKVKDKKTGNVISYKAHPCLIKKWKEPIAKLDTLLASTPSTENSQKIVEEFLSLDMFCNALAQYYNHPEYRTPNYDKFFKDYFAAIIQDRTPKITLRDLGYFIEYIPR